MKNIIINKMFKMSFLLAISSLLIVCVSCDDYLDVDEDNDNPIIAPTGQLFTNVILTVGTMGDFRLYSGETLQVYTHQFVVREDPDQYGTKADDISVNNDWENLYLTLTDIKTLKSQASAEGNSILIGCTQIIEAYLVSTAVDLWGDIPYDEATSLAEGIVAPNFQDQQEIYQSMLDLIDTAKSNINSGEGDLSSDADWLYSGETEKWIKFANTLKLKLFNQIRLSDLFTTNEANFNALIAEDNFFVSNADDFEYRHTSTEAPRDERNQLYRDTYGGTQVTKYASPWFYEILKGMNPNIHTGNADPRLPYYFANQLVAGDVPNDQGTEDPYMPNADYWDASTGFFSIRFGSIGPYRDNAVENDATFPGIFPCGGRYDDGQGFSADISSGTGLAPRRILTYDEYLYIRAELIHEGLLAGDEAATLREAIEASFAKVDKVVAESGTSQDVPTLVGETETTDFVDAIMAEFDAGDADKKLEIIMTQKWVATFGDALDQYADYRRTGYPVLADPKSTTGEYQLDNGDGFPLDDSFTDLNSDYPLSLFWPQIEINLNANAPKQKVPTSIEAKIFWDN